MTFTTTLIPCSSSVPDWQLCFIVTGRWFILVLSLAIVTMLIHAKLKTKLDVVIGTKHFSHFSFSMMGQCSCLLVTHGVCDVRQSLYLSSIVLHILTMYTSERLYHESKVNVGNCVKKTCYYLIRSDLQSSHFVTNDYQVHLGAATIITHKSLIDAESLRNTAQTIEGKRKFFAT